MPIQSRAIFRLIVGLVTGVILYALHYAQELHVWPATNGMVFAPLSLVASMVPLLILQGVGNVRGRTLVIWSLVATGFVAALAFYDIWSAPNAPGWFSPLQALAVNPPSPTPRITPSFHVMFALWIALFIGHSLVSSGDVDRKWIANYPTYFDVAWKIAVQFVLMELFVLAFWLLLLLGGFLFKLVGSNFLFDLYKHSWFFIPVTSLAHAMAIHVTDVRAVLVRGMRTLLLVLFSWLLPIFSVIVIAFLCAALLGGVKTLFATHYATLTMLSAALALTLLINAEYRDGADEQKAARLLRYSGTAASIALVPLVALSVYALAQRIGQYGWSVERVISAAITLVLACYAGGYAFAAVSRGAWMKRIERWNVYVSFVILAVLIALFSPIADPARIAVNDQMARLAAGQTPPDKFDLAFLRRQGGRFGQAALAQLAADDKYPEVFRTRAKTVLASPTGFIPALPRPTDFSNLTIHTPDGKLPDSFLAQSWPAGIPGCPTFGPINQKKCDIYVMDLKGGGSKQLLVVNGRSVTGVEEQADGKWKAFGNWSSPCGYTPEDLATGQFAAAAPEPLWPDLEIAGHRLRFHEILNFGSCAQQGHG